LNVFLLYIEIPLYYVRNDIVIIFNFWAFFAKFLWAPTSGHLALNYHLFTYRPRHGIPGWSSPI